jgi:hypothetical protein
LRKPETCLQKLEIDSKINLRRGGIYGFQIKTGLFLLINPGLILFKNGYIYNRMLDFLARKIPWKLGVKLELPHELKLDIL